MAGARLPNAGRPVVPASVSRAGRPAPGRQYAPPMIQLVETSKAYGEQVLLHRVRWRIGAGERIGLVGPNGSGKTTVLRILAGETSPDEGEVVRARSCRVGYLPQDGLELAGRTVSEEVKSAFADLLAQRRTQETLAERLAETPTEPGLLERYGELEEEWRRRGGYELDARVGEVLAGLGFSAEDRDRPVEEFSQGWQMRIALARLLVEANDLILLDEPTNYLDIEARNWLLEFLSQHRGGLVLVAHDRFFLDSVVTGITEVGSGQLNRYPGGFSAYETRRAAEIADLRKRAAEQEAEIERHERFISRFRYQASRARQVQSRVKLLERMERLEAPPARRRVRLSLPRPPRSGRVLLTLSGVSKRFGAVQVFENLDLTVERGERLALVGPNGAGKSTLIRLLAGAEAPDAGAREPGHGVRIAWYGPDRHDLDPERTVRQTMSDAAPLDLLPEIRNILGAFLFSGDAVEKRCAVLSGGERSRLALARMFLRPANLLLLDEPTNHLDLDAKAALLEALQEYRGTVVFVAHDRHFMDALATRVAVIGDGGAAVYWGNYSDWLARREQLARREAPASPKKPASPRKPAPPQKPASPKKTTAPTLEPPPVAPPAPGTRPSAQGERRRPRSGKNRRRALERRWRTLFDEIADAEAAIGNLEARMAAPDFWADREGSGRVAATHRELQSRLPALYAELARADAELAADSPGAARDSSPDSPSVEGSNSGPGPPAGRSPKQS